MSTAHKVIGRIAELSESWVRTFGAFLRDTCAGATTITAVAVTVMTLGGTALVVDHVSLVHKRDLLKSATDSASVAATLELARLPRKLSDADRDERLHEVAERYVFLNLMGNLGLEPENLLVRLDVDEGRGAVDVRVNADVGYTLLSNWLYDYAGPGEMAVAARTEHQRTAAEVVLAIDSSASMTLNLDGGLAGTPRLEIVKAAAMDQ